MFTGGKVLVVKKLRPDNDRNNFSPICLIMISFLIRTSMIYPRVVTTPKKIFAWIIWRPSKNLPPICWNQKQILSSHLPFTPIRTRFLNCFFQIHTTNFIVSKLIEFLTKFWMQIFLKQKEFFLEFCLFNKIFRFY